MNLTYFILAGLWSGVGANLAVRILSRKTNSAGVGESDTPWAEALGTIGGILAAFGLASLGVIDKAREAAGFSWPDFKWNAIVMLATGASGLLFAASYELATKKRRMPGR